jgi:hypothetical protein
VDVYSWNHHHHHHHQDKLVQKKSPEVTLGDLDSSSEGNWGN